MKAHSNTPEVRAVRHNRIMHDRIAQHYDTSHGEIYNPTEQNRINKSLHEALQSIGTESERALALDYGAGTGNITSHLLRFDIDVTAADVSPASLHRVVAKSEGSGRLNTVILNGKDLSNFEESTFDFIATYSVLHHVPDYLAIIDEFVRVLKPGGVIYIDHEACPSYWEFSGAYLGYLEELGDPLVQDYFLTLEIPDVRKGRVANLVTRLKRALARGKLTGPLLRRLNLVYDEGDIHVTPNDHIVWADIRNRLVPSCEVLLEEDYLVCREATEPAPVWAIWRDSVSDMRIMMARKRKVRAVM